MTRHRLVTAASLTAALIFPLALLASESTVGAYGTDSEVGTGNVNAITEPGDGAYRWGTVGHYALLGAEIYMSDDRYEAAREPFGPYPGLAEPRGGQGAGGLADGMVALHRAAAGDAALRLALPPETRAALGSTDVEGVALGIASLREAVRWDDREHNALYFALPPETRAALGEKAYAYDTPVMYGCYYGAYGACPDVEIAPAVGSDYEAYLRGTPSDIRDAAMDDELHGICAEAGARLAEGVAWMEGDASWLRFMWGCHTWHSETLSEAILEYMESRVSAECRGMIDAGWVVSDAGALYPQERMAGGSAGKPWAAGRPFDETCLLDTHPLALPIRTGWYNPPQAPSDGAYRWGTVGHYALLGAELYMSDDRYEAAREADGRRQGEPGLREGQGAGALASGMVSLHRAAAHDAALRLSLPPETRAALGGTDVGGIALGISALREAVRGDDRESNALYFALPPETRAALGEKVYLYSVPNFHCQITLCGTDELWGIHFAGSDYESYLRTHRGHLLYSSPDAPLAAGLRDICAKASASLAEGVAWMEGDASWLRFTQKCKHWHSEALSESILEYMESSVSAECKEMIDGGWTVNDAGMFHPPDRAGQDQPLPATGVTGQDRSPKAASQPFASACLPHSYPLGLPFPFDHLPNESYIPIMAAFAGQEPPGTP